MDGTEQRGGDLKILKRDGQAGSRGGCLKKKGGGGVGAPLRTMKYISRKILVI